jgi:prepilin-type N-terminal cleavage/methylation domain-containing protein
MKKNRKNSGFTLVELMIIVAIIGLLTAIAIPQFQNFINKSKLAVAITLLTAVHKSQVSFYANADEYFPPGASSGGGGAVIAFNFSGVQFFDLGPVQTKLGWTFSPFYGYGSSAPGPDRTVAYRVDVENDFDGDFWMDRFEIQVDAPFTDPETNGTVIHCSDDIINLPAGNCA